MADRIEPHMQGGIRLLAIGFYLAFPVNKGVHEAVGPFRACKRRESTLQLEWTWCVELVKRGSGMPSLVWAISPRPLCCLHSGMLGETVAWRHWFREMTRSSRCWVAAMESTPCAATMRDFSMQVSEDNIRLEREKGGGPLYDIGIYCINAARYALSEDPVEVWATATRSRDSRFGEVDETVMGAMRFRDERVASFTCSFGAADRSTYTITGTRGSITLDPAYEYAEGLSYELKIGNRTRKKQFGKSDQFAPELLFFSDCILQNRDPEPSGEEGLMDVRIMEAMNRSIRSGRWVKLAPAPRARRPTLRQEIRCPPVPREPPLVNAQPASR